MPSRREFTRINAARWGTAASGQRSQGRDAIGTWLPPVRTRTQDKADAAASKWRCKCQLQSRHAAPSQPPRCSPRPRPEMKYMLKRQTYSIYMPCNRWALLMLNEHILTKDRFATRRVEITPISAEVGWIAIRKRRTVTDILNILRIFPFQNK